jgi:hypothetical protein
MNDTSRLQKLPGFVMSGSTVCDDVVRRTHSGKRRSSTCSRPTDWSTASTVTSLPTEVVWTGADVTSAPVSPHRDGTTCAASGGFLNRQGCSAPMIATPSRSRAARGGNRSVTNLLRTSVRIVTTAAIRVAIR